MQMMTQELQELIIVHTKCNFNVSDEWPRRWFEALRGTRGARAKGRGPPLGFCHCRRLQRIVIFKTNVFGGISQSVIKVS